MMRSPRAASACLFFPGTFSKLDRQRRRTGAALALGLSVTLSIAGASAQTPPKGSPGHVKAVTTAVDGEMIRANTAMSND